MTVLCLPFAGAGGSFFAPWNDLAAPGVDVRPLHLPGRERLLDRAPHTDLHTAADDLLGQALDHVDGGPLAVFGHCFLGAVLAYELTRRLVTEASVPVGRLFVSAARGPGSRRPYGSEALDDDAFLALVERITGYRHEAFAVPAIRELLLPALRADFVMDETYTPRPGPRLNVPVTAVAAAADPLVTRAEVQEWAAVTDGDFEIVDLAGGHMYLAADARPLVGVLSTRLAPGRPVSEDGDADAKESPDAFVW